jgi:hypothetical protein
MNAKPAQHPAAAVLSQPAEAEPDTSVERVYGNGETFAADAAPDAERAHVDYERWASVLERQLFRDQAEIDRLRAAMQAYVDWEYRKRGAPRFTLTNLRAALAPTEEER